MARKKTNPPTLGKDNPKRSVAKLKRGKGVLAIAGKGVTEARWCEKLDPLFRVKGVERFERMKGVR